MYIDHFSASAHRDTLYIQLNVKTSLHYCNASSWQRGGNSSITIAVAAPGVAKGGQMPPSKKLFSSQFAPPNFEWNEEKWSFSCTKWSKPIYDFLRVLHPPEKCLAPYLPAPLPKMMLTPPLKLLPHRCIGVYEKTLTGKVDMACKVLS